MTTDIREGRRSGGDAFCAMVHAIHGELFLQRASVAQSIRSTLWDDVTSVHTSPPSTTRPVRRMVRLRSAVFWIDVCRTVGLDEEFFRLSAPVIYLVLCVDVALLPVLRIILVDALTNVSSSSPNSCTRGTRWPLTVE